MAFPHDDIRELMEDCEKAGELARITEEVDWNMEAGAISRRAMQIGGGSRSTKEGGQPAVLFENIKGYAKGYSILGNIIANKKRAAIMFGHPDPEKATWRELQDICMEGYDHPIKPVIVKDGPCKENKAFDDDCNLYMFPVPMIHDGDGGRYIATMANFNTVDKYTGWQNWGTYRSMVHDRRSLGCLMLHGQHGPDMYFDQYEPANEPMPFAFVIAPDMLSNFAGGAPVPHGVDEADIVGGWRKKPLELVKCETSDILVPAGSEIVVEGIFPPKIRAFEGPFGEYTGFRASPRDKRPVGVVKCITWRNNPIMGMSNVGFSVSESDVIEGISKGAIYKRILLDAGWPVVDVNCLPEATDFIAVSVKKGRPRVANGIMSVIQNSPCAIYSYKVLVCDEDTDVFSLEEIIHTITEKVHPERGIHVWRQQGSALAPYGDLKERLDQTAPQLLFDATWPLDWPLEIAVPPKVSFNEIYPKEIQEKVLQKWTKYGLKESPDK
ncbi:UbiD family decarboxylase [Chloroflexota bacterium]